MNQFNLIIFPKHKHHSMIQVFNDEIINKILSKQPIFLEDA